MAWAMMAKGGQHRPVLRREDSLATRSRPHMARTRS